MPFSINEEELISDVFLSINNAIQAGEDDDVKVRDFDPPEDEAEND